MRSLTRDKYFVRVGTKPKKLTNGGARFSVNIGILFDLIFPLKNWMAAGCSDFFLNHILMEEHAPRNRWFIHPFCDVYLYPCWFVNYPSAWSRLGYHGGRIIAPPLIKLIKGLLLLCSFNYTSYLYIPLVRLPHIDPTSAPSGSSTASAPPPCTLHRRAAGYPLRYGRLLPLDVNPAGVYPRGVHCLL